DGTTTNPYLITTTEAQNLTDVLTLGADANGTTITNLGTPINDADATTKLYVDDLVSANIADGSETNITVAGINTISGDGTTTNPYLITTTEAQNLTDVLTLGADANGTTITNLGTPTNDADATTKLYVDDLVSANIADGSETNITVAGINTISGDGTTTNPYLITATEAQNLTDVLTLGADANGTTITNLGTPTNDADATTKLYVDDAISTSNILNDGQIFVGNTSNIATAVTLSGDATLANDGILTIADDAVSIDKIDAESNAASFLGTDISGNPTWVSATSLVDGTTIGFNISQQLEVLDGGVTTTQIADATITNDDISATAAIDGSKIDPTFTTDVSTTGNLTTTGTVTVGANTITSTDGSAGQVLTTDGAGAATWADLPADENTEYIAGDALTLTGTEFSISDNAIVTSKIADGNITLSKLADGTAVGQLMQWDGTNWVLIEESAVNENLSNADLTQTAQRTYALNGNDLYFSGTGSIAIGSDAPGTNKLRVDGVVRATGYQAPSNASTGTPGYRFADDTNTGMSNPAADNLAFSSAGIEAMRINDSQNVGIATTAPNSTLDVKGSFSTTIRTDNNSTVTILADDYTVILGNLVTQVILPTATGVQGRIYILKNTKGATINTDKFYVPSDGGDGIYTLFSGITQLQSDGTNWQQIN
ncbi:hypothetical protein KO500_01145, partial [Cellulophaga baltica]|uniref:beta strand repeat-containing protein n=1 Tax=Cellulophaga TaxID=104264 RepID=UPI001C068E17